MNAELLIDKEQREQELNHVLNQFYKMLYVDFGLRAGKKIKEWYTMSWEEFKEELARNKVRISENALGDWKTYFHREKTRVNHLLKSY